CLAERLLCFALSSFFRFSSRRRHTRFSRDWSSDVCSSDLRNLDLSLFATDRRRLARLARTDAVADAGADGRSSHRARFPPAVRRSEERRVGKARKWQWLNYLSMKRDTLTLILVALIHALIA